ncbi:hypothetical protein KJ671_02465 [Patescibacteria group bacterium]|nr:hypothetical protein [Patescibacteria group bacterium]
MIELIKERINSVLKNKVVFDISASDKSEFGHYSSNIAFKLAPSLKKTSLEVAEDLVKKLDKSLNSSESIFSKIEVAGSGFINFWLKPEVFQKEQDVQIHSNFSDGENIIIEMVDAAVCLGIKSIVISDHAKGWVSKNGTKLEFFS